MSKITLAELEKEVEKSLEMFKELNIEEMEYKSIKFELKEMTSIGLCERVKFNKYVLYINPKADRDFLLDTITHELIHTLNDCYNHGKVFKMYCKMFNEKYGMNLGTYASPYEKVHAKYVTNCSCGATFGYSRMCKRLKDIKIGVAKCSVCKNPLTEDMINIGGDKDEE